MDEYKIFWDIFNSWTFQQGRAAGASEERGRGARQGHAARALGARLGRAAGLQAVHLVHSACF